MAAIVDGKNGSEDDFDVVGAGEFGHRSEIGFDFFERHGASVASDIVCTGEDDHYFGLKSDDVGAKTNEHLRSCLAADAAANVRLAGEKPAELWTNPCVGDGVAHEDDAPFVFRGRSDFYVGFAIADELGPVFQSGIHFRDAGLDSFEVVTVAGGLGRGDFDFGFLRRRSLGSESDCAKRKTNTEDQGTKPIHWILPFGILREDAIGENGSSAAGRHSRGRLVGGDGASTGPFADGGDVFGASDAERLRGGKFGEENLRGELLFGGESGVEARDDGLFDFRAGKTFAGPCELGQIEGCEVAAALF